MKPVIIDASVAIKWFIPEIHSISAACLLDNKFNLLVPDLIFAEVGNILWKKCRLKELEDESAIAILNDFKRIPFEVHESERLVALALTIATKHSCTVYDSLYVALAKIESGILVTADKSLMNSLKKTFLAKNLLWIEDTKNLKEI